MPDTAPESAGSFRGPPLSAVRRTLQTLLNAARIDDPPREARLLLEVATGLTAEGLLRDAARLLSDDEAKRLSEALRRRLAHEPLSRIKGERGFYGRTFAVSPAVLDPRPDTETLIDLVLQWVDETGGRQRPLTIIDVGTGSGCILITLLAELPNATGLATDLSSDALAIALTNAARHGVAERIVFTQARSLEGVDGPADILVSNPPYIPSADLAALDPGVRDYDPLLALDGGPDGLTVYRDIAARAGAVVPSGLIAVEVGAGQAADVAQILINSVENRVGLPWTRKDLGGHDRTVAMLTQR
jgi:release factor glutamine methyltransferase